MRGAGLRLHLSPKLSPARHAARDWGWGAIVPPFCLLAIARARPASPLARIVARAHFFPPFPSPSLSFFPSFLFFFSSFLLSFFSCPSFLPSFPSSVASPLLGLRPGSPFPARSGKGVGRDDLWGSLPARLLRTIPMIYSRGWLQSEPDVSPWLNTRSPSPLVYPVPGGLAGWLAPARALPNRIPPSRPKGRLSFDYLWR